jgi:hypothetical protein
VCGTYPQTMIKAPSNRMTEVCKGFCINGFIDTAHLITLVFSVKPDPVY